jgi:hypothetical protein
MLKWTFTLVSWVCCVVLFGLIVARPEELGVMLRGFGIPATVVDIFFTDRSVLWVCALSVAFLFAYAVPSMGSQFLHILKLRTLAADVASLRHEHRSLDGMESMIQAHAGLLSRLSPASHWAYETSSDQGDPQVAAKRLPSSMVSAQQLAHGHNWSAALRFMPQLLVLVALIFVMLALARSADKAFAEVLSVTNTDYGTMILGLRSAAAALAVALCASVVVWSIEKLLAVQAHAYSQEIVSGLDQIVTLEDTGAMDLTMAMSPAAPASTSQVEQLLAALHKKMAETDSALKELSKAQVSGATVVALQAALKNGEGKQDSVLSALQQSMDELHGLRKEVDSLRAAPPQVLPTPSNDQAASRLTSAIRALKDSAASDLPQL